MKKFITANLVAIVSLLGTVIIGLSSIAWTAEKKNIYKDIKEVRVTSNVQDSLIWNEFGKHNLKHIDEEKQRIERDQLNRDYFDAKFEGLEKLIISNKN